MKTNMNMIFSAPLATLAFGAFLAQAAADTVSTNTAPTVSGTNSNSEAAMTALFGDPVIAKGKGFEIKRSQLDEVMSAIKARAAVVGRTIPPEQLTQYEAIALNDLIGSQLLLQKATDADKAEGKTEAELQFTNILKRLGSQEAFERQLRTVGMTVAELRARLTQDSVAGAAMRRELNVSTTDADAKTYYTNHPGDFEQPEKVRLCDILLLTVDPATHTPLATYQQQDKRKSMGELLKRARSGESFTNLAAQYSEDPNSKDNGGELPPLSRDQMSPELAATAFSLTNNQVSDVIEMSYGYCIVKLLDKIPAKKLDYASVADDLKEALTRQKAARLAPAYLDKLKKASGVEILDPDLKALEAAMEAAVSNSPAVTPEK
jgi:parvulin-like peptidyl-prolyl isomerase